MLELLWATPGWSGLNWSWLAILQVRVYYMMVKAFLDSPLRTVDGWQWMSVWWECILGCTLYMYLSLSHTDAPHASPTAYKQPLGPFDCAIKQHCLKRANRSNEWINTTPACVFYVASFFDLFLPTWSTGWRSQSHSQKLLCMGVEVLRASLNTHTLHSEPPLSLALVYICQIWRRTASERERWKDKRKWKETEKVKTVF